MDSRLLLVLLITPMAAGVSAQERYPAASQAAELVQASPQAAGSAVRYEHRLLNASKAEEVEGEMNQLAASGFRFSCAVEAGVVMSRVIGAPATTHHYKVVEFKLSLWRGKRSPDSDLPATGFWPRGVLQGVDLDSIIFEDSPAPESYEYRMVSMAPMGLRVFRGGLNEELTRSGTEGFAYVASLPWAASVILRRPQQGTQLPWEYVRWRLPRLGLAYHKLQPPFCEQTFRLVAPGLCARQRGEQGSFEYTFEIPSSPSTFRYVLTIYDIPGVFFPVTSYNRGAINKSVYGYNAVEYVFERAVATAPQPMCTYKLFSGKAGHRRDRKGWEGLWPAFLLEAGEEGFLPVAAMAADNYNVLGERCVEPNSQ